MGSGTRTRGGKLVYLERNQLRHAAYIRDELQPPRAEEAERCRLEMHVEGSSQHPQSAEPNPPFRFPNHTSHARPCIPAMHPILYLVDVTNHGPKKTRPTGLRGGAQG